MPKKGTGISFRTTLLKTGANTTGIQVPEEVIEKLGGGKRPLVRVAVGQYTYRSAVALMGGKFLISMSAEHRQAAGLAGGEAIEVTLELDAEPRTVAVPDDLRAALVKSKRMEAFEQSAPSARKEFVRQVEEAKAPETRARRIAKIVEKLS